MEHTNPQEEEMLSPNYPIDPDTGMPALPGPDYRWRVSYAGLGLMDIDLQRRHVGIWWYVQGTSTEDPTPENIRKAAVRVLERRDERTEFNRIVDKLSGTYPPKKLEG